MKGIVSGSFRPLLALDFDDTLLNVTEPFLSFHKRVWGYAPTYDSISSGGALAPFLRISAAEEEARWTRFFTSPEYLSLALTEDQLRGLKALREKFDLVVVTNRSPQYEASVPLWVDAHLSGYFSRIDFVSRFPEGERNKGAICRQIGAVALIDDVPENLPSCRECGVCFIVFDQPWNRKMSPGVPRVRSFGKVMPIVGNILPLS